LKLTIIIVGLFAKLKNEKANDFITTIVKNFRNFYLVPSIYSNLRLDHHGHK